jgi:glycosyltransferase involved in cell wall biosynthesis
MATKLRVMLCASSYPPDIRGGGEISTELIAKGLAKLGVDLRLLTFTRGASRVEVIDDVRVQRLRCPNIYWSNDSAGQPAFKKAIWHSVQAIRFWPPKCIRQAIESFEPNVLHTSTIEDFGAGTWRWAASLGYRTVHTLRSYNLIHHQATLYEPSTDSERGADVLSYPKKFYSHSLDGVIGISQYILNRHVQAGFFRRAKNAVIPNPCGEPILERTSFKQGAVKLGILGRIAPEKGIHQFISALIATNIGMPWKLEIAGTGPKDYTDHLQELSQGHPILFVGWKDSRTFLSSIDLLVVPSRWQEPFGRIVVEAFSVGLPVLCLKRGGLPELVQQDRNGWVANDWSSEIITRAIKQCRTVDRNAITEDAKRYTIDLVATQHLEFYKSLSCDAG